MSFWKKLFGDTKKTTSAVQLTSAISSPKATSIQPPTPETPPELPRTQARSSATREQSNSIRDAIRLGELGKVKSLVEGNPDLVFDKDYLHGSTPLHLAAELGRKEVAEFLLVSNSDVNAKDNVRQAAKVFFEKNGTSWNHQLWLGFLNGVRATISIREMPDAEVGQVLEAEAAAEKQRRLKATTAVTPKPANLRAGDVVPTGGIPAPASRERSREEMLRDLKELLLPQNERGHTAILHPQREFDAKEFAEDVQRARLEAARRHLLDLGGDDLIPHHSGINPIRKLTEAERQEFQRHADVLYEQKREKHLRTSLEPVAKKWGRSVDELLRMAMKK